MSKWWRRCCNAGIAQRKYIDSGSQFCTMLYVDVGKTAGSVIHTNQVKLGCSVHTWSGHAVTARCHWLPKPCHLRWSYPCNLKNIDRGQFQEDICKSDLFTADSDLTLLIQLIGLGINSSPQGSPGLSSLSLYFHQLYWRLCQGNSEKACLWNYITITLHG